MTDNTTNNIESQASQVAEFSAIDTYSNKDVVEISDSTTYTNTINNISTFAASYIGKEINVAHVDNETINGRGICWMASTASAVQYYQDHYPDSSKAESIKDEIIYSYTGTFTTQTISNYILSYTGLNSTKGNMLSWSEVKKYILNKNTPIYTEWWTEGKASGHSMVLCGYRYDKNNPSSMQYYYCTLMDPNEDNKQLIGFGNDYIISIMDILGLILLDYSKKGEYFL